MPNSALATGESLMASVPAPPGLEEARELERAQTPAAHLAGLRDTLANEDDDDPPTDEARIDTVESDLPPDDDVPARAPEGASPSAKTNPVTPLHPTPVLAGEVIETGQTAVYGAGGQNSRKLAIAAVLGVCVAGGAIWALTGGPQPEPKQAPVVSAGATRTTADQPKAAPAIAPADPSPSKVDKPVEPTPQPQVPAPVAASDRTAKKKAKKRRKKKGKAGVSTAATSTSTKPAPPPPPKPSPKKARVSKAKTLYAKANKAFAGGKHAKAVSLYREAMVAGYRKAEIHYQLGRAYMRMSKAQDARRHFETYLRKYPNSPKRKMVEAILKQGR